MNNEFVTIAPATDAFTNVLSRLQRSDGDDKLRQISSVAFSRPPTERPSSRD
jgi:hypothetical protein